MAPFAAHWLLGGPGVRPGGIAAADLSYLATLGGLVLLALGALVAAVAAAVPGREAAARRGVRLALAAAALALAGGSRSPPGLSRGARARRRLCPTLEGRAGPGCDQTGAGGVGRAEARERREAERDRMNPTQAAETSDAGAQTERRRRPPLAKLALGLAALLAMIWLGREAGGYVPRFAEWVDGLGPLGPVAFVAGYALAVVAFVPGSLLTLAAGAIFGVLEGTALVLVGATLGSTAAFLLARSAAREAVARRVEGDRRFAAIDRAIEREGRRIVFLLRLSPVFPFNLLNYALGLTRVRLVDYVVASAGMLPGTLLYVYSGKVAGELATLAGGSDVARGAGYYAVVGLGFAATVVVTVLVTRVARRALAEATGE